MKALAGGLINSSAAAYAYIAQYDNVLPIWGIQRMSELEEFLSYMESPPEMTEEIQEIIAKDKASLAGDFCRGCGYCMPCPSGISIPDCARMSLKTENCLHCGACMKKCPYSLNIPELLVKNYEDYKRILAGEITV